MWNSHLKHRMSTPQKLDKTGYDTTFDHFFNGRILLFRQKLPKFGRGIKLTFSIVREYATDHLLIKLQDSWVMGNEDDSEHEPGFPRSQKKLLHRSRWQRWEQSCASWRCFLPSSAVGSRPAAPHDAS